MRSCCCLVPSTIFDTLSCHSHTFFQKWLWLPLHFRGWPHLDNWMAENGDQIGWRVLKVTYMLMRGMVLRVNIMKWIFLYRIVALTFVYFFTQTSTKHGHIWVDYSSILHSGLGNQSLCLAYWPTFIKIAFCISLQLWLFLLSVRLLPKRTKSINLNSVNAHMASLGLAS